MVGNVQILRKGASHWAGLKISGNRILNPNVKYLVQIIVSNVFLDQFDSKFVSIFDFFVRLFWISHVLQTVPSPLNFSIFYL